jgi:hypothetical protein
MVENAVEAIFAMSAVATTCVSLPKKLFKEMAHCLIFSGVKEDSKVSESDLARGRKASASASL